MILGFERISAAIRNRISRYEERVGAEMLECAKETADLARDMAPEGVPPRREPRLKDSFSAVSEGLTARAVVSNPHAAYVEFGTGQRGAATGRLEGGYDGDWPGMNAQPYMYPAAQAMRAGFVQRIARAAREAGGER